ncbi:MAG: hypothetical protein AB4290_03015 [Spirulina sp.]
MARYDRIAYEFDMWGDFKTDLAVGDSQYWSFNYWTIAICWRKRSRETQLAIG